MKASELRVGNLVCVGKNQDGTDQIGLMERLDSERYNEWEGEDVSFTYSIGTDMHNLYNADEVYPIPLTEEWLIKAGAKPFNNDSGVLAIDAASGFPGARFDIDFREDKIYLKSRYDKEDLLCQVMPYIKHVHQLQNLYYALTGQELEFKD